MAAAFREAAALSVSQAARSLVELLTPREQEVLKLIIEGKSNREIADALTIELSTVKWYVNQIYSKLNVRSRVQAIVRARELDLIVDWVHVPAGATTIGTSGALPEPENPYKGLRAFQAADEQDFFGREKLTEKLLKRIGQDGDYGRFLAVVGPSGSGKSSLVKAGLVPALWRGELPGSEKWFIVEMVPGAHPLDELEIALVRVAADPSESLRDQLERDARGLVRAAQIILPDDGSELVIVIDQCEEVFTLVEDEDRRAHFLALLHTAVTDPRSRVRIVVTLRADFYDRPLNYPDFGQLVQARTETVLPLSAEELERAIGEPAERVGIKFEEGLVPSIIQDVHYQPGALPLLQYALTELFEQRENRTLTHAAYQAIGGTVGALAKRADEVYESMSEDGQAAIRQMFLRMVTLGEGVEDTRRRVPRSELLAISDDPDLVDELIDTYTAYRLLSLDNDPATRSPTVEVAHEAMLREWERLRDWLDESREDIRFQRRLAAAADEWQAAEEDASFLLRGTRLDTLKRWADETELALTRREQAFLDACLADRGRRRAEEEAQQAREARLEQRARRVLQGLVGVALVAAVVSGALALWANGNRILAEREAETNHSLVLAASARNQYDAGHTDLGLHLALEAVSIDNPPFEAVQTLTDVAYSPGTVEMFEWYDAGEWSTGVAFSPDGRAIASGSSQGSLLLWDLDRNQEVWRAKPYEQLWESSPSWKYGDGLRVAFSPDGSFVATSVHTGGGEIPYDTISLLDAQDGSLVWELPGIGLPDAFSPDSQYFLTIERAVETAGFGDIVEASSDIIMWDLESGEEVTRFSGSEAQVLSVAFSPDGTHVASGELSPVLRIWDVQTGEQVQQIPIEEQAGLRYVRYRPDGRHIDAIALDDRLLFDLETGRQVEINDTASAVEGLSTSSAGQLSAHTTDLAGDWSLWDNEQWREVQTFDNTPAGVHPTDTAFSPDDNHVLVAYTDGSARLWGFTPPALLMEWGDGTPVTPIDISPDGTQVLSGHTTGDAILWDFETGNELLRIPAAAYRITEVDFSPDGQSAVITGHDYDGEGQDTFISIWDLAANRAVRQLDASQVVFPEEPELAAGRYGVWTASFSPDGRYLFTGSAATDFAPLIDGKLIEGKLVQWDVESGEMVRTLDIGDAHSRIAYISDGQQMVESYHYLSIVDIWDVATGERLVRYEAPENDGLMFAVLPDEERLMAASAFSGTMFLRDLMSGEIILNYVGHQAGIWDVEISPDGTTAISGDLSGDVILWDVESGEMLQRFTEHEGPVWNVAYSPDGQSALSAGDDGRIIKWQVGTPPLDELLQWVRENRVLRELTPEELERFGLSPVSEQTGEGKGVLGRLPGLVLVGAGVVVVAAASAAFVFIRRHTTGPTVKADS